MAQRFKIGFEFEFAVRHRRKNIVMAELEHILQSDLTVAPWAYDYSRWTLADDGSIVSEKWNNYHRMELVSPVLPLTRAKTVLRRIMTWMNKNPHVELNWSTGLHINVSVHGDNNIMDLDPVKFLSFVNDLDALKRWDRIDNEYCTTYAFNLRRIIADYMKVKDKTGEKFLDFARERLDKRKYHSVNFLNIAWENDNGTIDPGWLEYRVIGGDYAARSRDVFNELDHLLACVKKAISPYGNGSVLSRLVKMNSGA